MKKQLLLLSILITLITLISFSVTADDFVKEGEFAIASFNGVNSIVKNESKHTELEDACWWLVTSKDEYNIKYVSFIGQIGNANTLKNSTGLPKADFINLCLQEEAFVNQYKKFANIIAPLREEGIPNGVSMARQDYASNGYSRQSVLPEYLSCGIIMPSGVTYEYHDEANYCTFIKNGDATYMVFQLELWPTEPVLGWFKGIMAQNPDKYAIVYTTSFVDESGAMYTMWDWDVKFEAIGTSQMKSYSISWDSHAHDGEGIWNKAFSHYDNILAVVSSNITGAKIVTSTFKNERGYETASIAANSESLNVSNGPTVLLTKFSPDNKQITVAWATPFKGIIKDSVTAVKLSNIGPLSSPAVDTSLPQVSVQYNGANKAYIFGYDNNTFRPNANMTRAEACTIFARLILGTQTIPSEYTTRFTDVKSGDWFYNAVAFLDEKGFFERNTSTTYKPNEPITRAEFVELANLASTLTPKKAVSFKDMPEDHFYHDSVIAAAASGLVNGYEDGTFRPDNTITRAEVVTVINRLLGLKTSERTVSLSHLENEFVDIKTHWARLNILMASNSNVHGDYYYEASLNGVKDGANDFTISNKHISIVISKMNGKVKKMTNLATGENIMGNSKTFVTLLTEKDEAITPSKLEADGNRIKITFKNDSVVYMIVDVHDNFMTFEIDSEIAPGHKRVEFATTSTILKAATKDTDYMLNSIGMTAWTNPVVKGYRETADNSTAYAYSQYASGTMGAKLGIVFSTKKDALPFLQELTDTIDPKYGIKSKAGGAYAQEWEGNFGDYAIINDTNPETIDKTIEMMLEIGADQVDLHEKSTTTFRSGDFHFAYTETGSAKEYYEKIGYKFDEAGLETALHTYAYYITPDSENILKDPKWQKQLEVLPDVWTLRTDMSATRTTIPTVEDASGFDLKTAFFYKNMRYVLIDNEIIYIGEAIGSGFIKVQRGQAGTTPATHKKGTPIYHLSGFFGRFVPILGSELFYHIADLTAKAYNEGGFSMIYLDAIDGLQYHLPEGHETWYYHQTFLQRIISQCEKPPVVETSAGSPQEWLARGRTGAWDTGNRSIKKYINIHIEANKNSMKQNMVTTLGWFDFMPDLSTTSGLRNTIEKTMFHDDLDAAGMGALLYNMTIVYHSFSVEKVENNPFNRANINYYNNFYAKLRKSHYFSDEVINEVKAIGGEWKVIEKNPGEYAFLQMYYAQANLGNVKDSKELSYTANNPFKAQTPFIRIESRYSTLFENPTVVAEFDENTPLTKPVTTKTFAAKNLRETMAMSVRVKGTGADGDALLISFQSKNSAGSYEGRTDHFIDLNFEGWREFILLDSDSADYDTSKYSFSGITDKQVNYDTFRNVPYYNRISYVAVRTSGKTAGNAQIGNITAYTHTTAPIENPSVSIGSEKITFNCKITASSYLEFDPITNKAILYNTIEQSTKEVPVTGTITAPSGDFKAIYSAEALTDAPIRARLTLGFSGQEIKN